MDVLSSPQKYEGKLKSMVVSSKAKWKGYSEDHSEGNSGGIREGIQIKSAKVIILLLAAKGTSDKSGVPSIVEPLLFRSQLGNDDARKLESKDTPRNEGNRGNRAKKKPRYQGLVVGDEAFSYI
uniref:Uncharacterized protein n=1 Tax=Moniliophthora roreri TaxID=221103 RepID=A0A0W0FHI5_MONRR